MWPFKGSYPELSPCQVGVLAAESASLNNKQALYDYIIIGGGTAGCVIASRLSEDRDVKVLLVEQGVLADTWASRVPLISSDFSRPSAPIFKWKSSSQKYANDKQLQIFAGKALGGTTRVNMTLYTRGAPAEWNSWGHAGRKGWSYEEMLPYFMKSEKAADTLVGSHHGRHGVWLVRTIDTWSFSFWPRIIKAATSLGFPHIEDLNNPSSPMLGSALIHRTLDAHGQRHATSSAFLPLHIAADRRDNLKICTATIVTKIDVGELGGRLAAKGIFFRSDSDSNKLYYAGATREIVLSAGTFGSPQILLLSGIGPKAHLKEFDIKIIKDAPGVGEHLMDHVGVSLSWKVPLKDSLHIIQVKIWLAILHLLQYIIYGTGLFLFPVSQVVILVRSALLSPTNRFSGLPPVPPSNVSPSLDPQNPANIPDLEILPVPVNMNPANTFTTREGVFSLLVILVQPKSTGSVRLTSTDPSERPVVDLGTFTAEEDVAVLRKGLRFALSLAREMKREGWSSMQDYELPASEDNHTLNEWIRRGAQSVYHYSSTCRMAPEDDERPGVVDDELKVHGIDRLRIADASVFPSILATHTQAPVVAVAEKCADMIKQSWR